MEAKDQQSNITNFHITKILRPHSSQQHKHSQNHPSSVSTKIFESTLRKRRANITTLSTAERATITKECCESSAAVVTNAIDFIPTLQFIVHTPEPLIYIQQEWQQCLHTFDELEQQQGQQQYESNESVCSSSQLTYTVEELSSMSRAISSTQRLELDGTCLEVVQNKTNREGEEPLTSSCSIVTSAFVRLPTIDTAVSKTAINAECATSSSLSKLQTMKPAEGSSKTDEIETANKAGQARCKEDEGLFLQKANRQQLISSRTDELQAATISDINKSNIDNLSVDMLDESLASAKPNNELILPRMEETLSSTAIPTMQSPLTMEANTKSLTSKMPLAAINATTAKSFDSSTTDAEESIEEEIEGVIESVSASVSVSSTPSGSELQSTSNDSLTPGAGVSNQGSKRFHTDHHVHLSFTSENSSNKVNESGNYDSNHDAVNFQASASDDGQFKIDAAQLSGGKLVQHFLTPDDDDDDVDDDNDEDKDEDIVDNKMPSKAASNNNEEANKIPEFSLQHDDDSLENQNTADEVSDLVDEVKNDMDLDVDVDVDVDAVNEQHSSYSIYNHNAENATKPYEAPLLLPLSAASEISKNFSKNVASTSPLHSEKDHFVDEIMASNHSIEISTAEKDLGSLDSHFDEHNDNLQLELLLADTKPAETITNKFQPNDAYFKETYIFGNPSKVSVSLSERNHPAVETEKASTSAAALNIVHAIEKSENICERTVTDLDDGYVLDESNSIKPKQVEISNTAIATQLPESKEAADDDESNSLKNLKLHLLAMQQQQQNNQRQQEQQEQHDFADNLPSSTHESMALMPALADGIELKAMERISVVDFTKDVLEDITEESERNSISNTIDEAPPSSSLTLTNAKAGFVATAETTVTVLPPPPPPPPAPSPPPPPSSSSSSSLSVIPTTSTDSYAKPTVNTTTSIATTTTIDINTRNFISLGNSDVGGTTQMLVELESAKISDLENSNRRESPPQCSSEQLGSGRDTTSSLITSSTEYRTLNDDLVGPVLQTADVYAELNKRNELIGKLTNSLQQSVMLRDSLQNETDKLNAEVEQLRKQLADNNHMDVILQPVAGVWRQPDQESIGGGQRISEISMDLVSGSDEDYERQYLTDNDEKSSHHSRERRSSPTQHNMMDYSMNALDMDIFSNDTNTAFSKQIEQFQKCLTPNEIRPFFMVKKKFDNYLNQELETMKMKYELELKTLKEQLVIDKNLKDAEIERLLIQKFEREAKHEQEMEDLRKYFENKCTDLEKQFSDDVFSQKSQRHSLDTQSSASEYSDHDDEFQHLRSKDTSPKKRRSRAELLSSPSHRQLTPSTDAVNNRPLSRHLEMESSAAISELRTYYQNQMAKLQRNKDQQIQQLNQQLKYYEERYAAANEDAADDDTNVKSQTSQPQRPPAVLSPTETTITTPAFQQQQQTQQSKEIILDMNADDSGNNLPVTSTPLPPPTPRTSPVTTISSRQPVNNDQVTDLKANTSQQHENVANAKENKDHRNDVIAVSSIADQAPSLIVIDRDELLMNDQNETHVIEKIMDEYETRLKEQLALARQDFFIELEQQIQNISLEAIADDRYWPKGLLLLREKLNANSERKMSEMQREYEDELLRLQKREHEQQMNRRERRNQAFDSSRDYDALFKECGHLRTLTESLRTVLAHLSKNVATCATDLNVTLTNEMQRLLFSSNSLDDSGTLNSSVLSYVANISSRLLPDVRNIINVVDDPNLINYISNESQPANDSFDLNYCLGKLHGEALHLLELSKQFGAEGKCRSYSDGMPTNIGDGIYINVGNDNDNDNDNNNDFYFNEIPLNSDYRTNEMQELSLLQPQNATSGAELKLLSHNLERMNLNAEIAASSMAVDGNFGVAAAAGGDGAGDGGNPAAVAKAKSYYEQLLEMESRLNKSEAERMILQQELGTTIARFNEMSHAFQNLRNSMSGDHGHGHGNGHGTNSPNNGTNGNYNRIKYSQMNATELSARYNEYEQATATFMQLQDRTRQLLFKVGDGFNCGNDTTTELFQLLEDYFHVGDKMIDYFRTELNDLQSQIDTADKQLKSLRKFMDEQANEREHERDEYIRKIDELQLKLRECDKERSNYAKTSDEVENLEGQLRDLNKIYEEVKGKRDKFEFELKASIDKIFVLREVITDLETDVETKALNEHVLSEKLKQLEGYIHLQSNSNKTLQNEVDSLKTEIEQSYQMRIKHLEQKLQNMRPTSEQSLLLEQVIEQLNEIETKLDEKTKNLEALHQANNSSSCSLSATEDVSVQTAKPSSSAAAAAATATATAKYPNRKHSPDDDVNSLQGSSSPTYPSPRQHSITVEGVQRIADKLMKHTRVEEATIKRLRELDMQIGQMKSSYVELQGERESLQERMFEQTQRISALQSRLEEQRQRAEELQRSNTSDLNIRIHDLQGELRNLKETLTVRDKQINTMKQQLEKSKVVIDRLEGELAAEHQAEHNIIANLEHELQQRQSEIEKLQDKIKCEKINKLAIPDLMETMLADKNEEIDHLKEQLEIKGKELQRAIEMSKQNSRLAGKSFGKLRSNELNDNYSANELDEEPEMLRRAITIQNTSSPLILPEGNGGFLHHTMDSSKATAGNLTNKRTDDLNEFVNLQQANTFGHSGNYFQQIFPTLSASTGTPDLMPRQINFSEVTEDSKLKTPSLDANKHINCIEDRKRIECLEKEVKELVMRLRTLSSENELNQQAKEKQIEDLQAELTDCQKDLMQMHQQNDNSRQLQAELIAKSLQIENLQREQDKLKQEKSELLSKNEKNLRNYKESEENLMRRLKELEAQLLKNTEREVREKESLRKELQSLGEIHEKCKYTILDLDKHKHEIENLNRELQARDDRLLALRTKLTITEESISEMHRQVITLEREVEKLRQQHSDNSSKQLSVDEIAQQLEKELNYSVQLDSNILKAIESEEENNLERAHAEKHIDAVATDDENFTGERELLNQLEALKAQIAVEREQNEETRKELLLEKQHSQEIQEQDVLIIEAMRKRLEAILEQEEEIHKELENEKERCERLQNQLTSMQRFESRRNSILLKSPIESPKKSPRSANDYDSEITARLQDEIKLLMAQNQRERERSSDLQKTGERERRRYEKELQERIEYCNKLKDEMEKLAKDKENAENQMENLQERLSLQIEEIESLEARLNTLQEAENRRQLRRGRQHKETTHLNLEIHELKTQLMTVKSEKENLNKIIQHLRCDIELASHRETKLADALANVNSCLARRDSPSLIPEQFLQKMKDINKLLAANSQENKQMAETVQHLVEERRHLQRKCDELELKAKSNANLNELNERCNHLLARYLRIESYRKALVYQKRYLKITLHKYQQNEERVLATLNMELQAPNKSKYFKTVALAIIAIERLKFIGRSWKSGKRMISKSAFIYNQQHKRHHHQLQATATNDARSSSPTSHTTTNYKINTVVDSNDRRQVTAGQQISSSEILTLSSWQPGHSLDGQPTETATTTATATATATATTTATATPNETSTGGSTSSLSTTPTQIASTAAFSSVPTPRSLLVRLGLRSEHNYN